MSTTSFLDRMLDPITDSMSREFAESLVALKADDEFMARIDVLRRKANQGSLSPEEEAEYKDFVESLDVGPGVQKCFFQVDRCADPLVPATGSPDFFAGNIADLAGVLPGA